MKHLRRSAAIILAAVLAAPALARQDKPVDAPSASDRSTSAFEPGVSLRVYDSAEQLQSLPQLVEGQTPNFSVLVPKLDLTDADFGPTTDNFYAVASGFLKLDQPGTYTFKLRSDDGSVLWIGDQMVIDYDGPHSAERYKTADADLKAGTVPIKVMMFQGGVDRRILLEWKKPGDTGYSIVPTSALSTEADQVRVTSPGPKKMILDPRTYAGRPGDGEPLKAVNPCFDLTTLNTGDFKPKVGGMDFLPDGRLALCTWDPEGGVYLLDGVTGQNVDPAKIKITRFADGLAEPLGLKVVDGKIYVLQKQELTELEDTTGDGHADVYKSVSEGWNVTANFHEFAFGLVHKDGFFYATLAVALNPGGHTTDIQTPGRGECIKIDPTTGSYETVVAGLRTPNGIGLGPDDEIFVMDNQGDWLPSSKLIHIEQGRFFNAHITPDSPLAGEPVTPPALWLPQGEIGNSPSQFVMVKDGPFAGQMLHGDVTHGGIKRDFLEKIDGDYQGAVFRFSQGMYAGVNRLCWGPDGDLYVGLIGSTGNWNDGSGHRFGLQKLHFNGKLGFEMLAMRAKTNGFEVEFTKPLAEGQGWDPEDYKLSQWRYEPTNNYGGPKVGEQDVKVKSATVSADRKKVFLEIDGLIPKNVVYLHVMPTVQDEANEPLWATEAWYTLNAIPAGEMGEVKEAPPQNGLTAAEKSDGWKLLFDGKDLDGWRGFREKGVPDGWKAEGGAITRVGDGPDLITDQKYGDFELALQWKVPRGGNSGVIYRASEAEGATYLTGPEMQVLDDAHHPDGFNVKTSAGSAYALYGPTQKAVNPFGVWNRARLVVKGNHVEHWLNGKKVVEYELNSPDWRQHLAESKFADTKPYGQETEGFIALQNHGDRVQFRDIKIRPLD